MAERFPFGENWSRFLAVIDDERVAGAERSLRDALAVARLDGVSMLDVGCGSGLSSLAAHRLGAAPVHSFDVDPASVACARELRRRWRAEDGWTVEQGSVLDRDYLRGLGTFDLVYSWGVVHHTGAMWHALANLDELVAPGGALYLAVYNDQGMRSHLWRWVKRTYNRLPRWLRGAFAALVMGPRELVLSAPGAARRPTACVRAWTGSGRARGMSRWHDLVDWVGGYPFEVARPEEVFAFFRDRGYELRHLRTSGGGIGCNEYVFVRRP